MLALLVANSVVLCCLGLDRVSTKAFRHSIILAHTHIHMHTHTSTTNAPNASVARHIVHVSCVGVIFTIVD